MLQQIFSFYTYTHTAGEIKQSEVEGTSPLLIQSRLSPVPGHVSISWGHNIGPWLGDLV